jgi:tetratricopeptide (TPR) repeat protein
MNNPYNVLGVPETASDAEVKKAYLNLARKYHPDNYHDSPLEDLAQEKMKEINAAYEEINKQRSGKGASGSQWSSASSYGNYGNSTGGTERQSWSGQSFTPLQRVRTAINAGDLFMADSILNGYSEHNAEWNFLRGAVCYRRGMLDEAKRYYQTACQMDPNNEEYQQALHYMENGSTNFYRPDDGTFGTSLCGDGLCPKLCCAFVLCNSCGYWGFCR